MNVARQTKNYVETNPEVLMPDEALHSAHAVTISADAELQAIMTAVTEDQIRFSEQIGAFKMATATRKFLNVFRIKFLAEVKESKKYKDLTIVRQDGNTERVRTWEEFCNAIGYSSDLIDENIRNVRAFGEEALESMGQIGLGYRELRQLRRVPEDQKAALIEAAKAGDKDSFLELAEDLIAKHVREKEEAEKRIASMGEEIEDTRARSAEKSQQIEALHDERLRIKRLPPDEVLAQLRKEATAIHNDARGAIIGQLRQAVIAVVGHHETHGGDSTVFLAGLVGQLTTDLAALRDEFFLPTVDANEHGWIDNEN